jgi:hypothetical protein
VTTAEDVLNSPVTQHFFMLHDRMLRIGLAWALAGRDIHALHERWQAWAARVWGDRLS